MVQVASIAPSNRPAIAAGLVTIATLHAGVTFAGSNTGQTPLPADISYPWLTVISGDRPGYARNGSLAGGDLNSRQLMAWEPVTEFKVCGIYEYNAQTFNSTIGAAIDADRDAVELALMAYHTGYDTCEKITLVSAKTDWMVVEAREVYGFIIVVRAYEMLDADYDI